MSTSSNDAPAAAAGRGASLEEPAVRRRVFDLVLEYGIFVALAIEVVIFAILSPYFLTYQNVLNIAQAASVTGIMAAGITVALIAGQLDLSIGAVLGLSAVTTAVAIQWFGLPTFVGALLGVLVALLVGLVNGMLVVDIGINSIIVTIAVSLTVRGAAQIITNGQTVPLTDLSLQSFVNSRPLGIPIPFIMMAIVFVAFYVLLTQTRTGWHIYAVGSNESAALRAGIKTRRLYRGVFIVTAAAAGLCGVITAGRAAGGGPAFGDGVEFAVLTAVLLGGIGLSGGAGRVERTLAGVALIGVLNNGLTLLSVDAYVQATIRGSVFVGAVVLAAVAARRSAR